MADNRKYYYLKLKEDFFDTDEMKILESMKDGYLYSNILLKLYLKSLSNSGRLMYRNVIPYTPEILATLTGHQVGTVEKALDVFKKLDLIEMLDNGAIYMMDIQNFIGQSSSEADRQREYYNRMKAEKEALAGESTETPELPEPKEPVLPVEQKSNKAIGNYTTDFEELWDERTKEYIQLQAVKLDDDTYMVQEFDNELVFMGELWSGCKYPDEVLDWMKSNYEIESCLTAEVYRSSLGDCTNNGVSSYARELYILDAQKGPFEPDDIRQCVYIEKREIMGQEYVDCKPAYCRKRWYMAGGNILYTSDSRFKQITGISYPIAIHDRYEGR